MTKNIHICLAFYQLMAAMALAPVDPVTASCGSGVWALDIGERRLGIALIGTDPCCIDVSCPLTLVGPLTHQCSSGVRALIHSTVPSQSVPRGLNGLSFELLLPLCLLFNIAIYKFAHNSPHCA